MLFGLFGLSVDTVWDFSSSPKAEILDSGGAKVAVNIPSRVRNSATLAFCPLCANRARLHSYQTNFSSQKIDESDK